MTLSLPPHLSGRAALRPRDLYEAFGLSKSKVRRLVKDQKLDAVKLDGIVLVSVASVERWLSTAEPAK